MSINFVKPIITINGTGNENKNFLFWERGFEINGAIGGGYRDVTIAGQMSLTLLNAKANSLSYLKAFGKCEQNLLPDEYQLYTSVEANGVTYEYSSQNLTQIPCKRIEDNVFGLYNYTTKVFISEV